MSRTPLGAGGANNADPMTKGAAPLSVRATCGESPSMGQREHRLDRMKAAFYDRAWHFIVAVIMT